MKNLTAIEYIKKELEKTGIEYQEFKQCVDMIYKSKECKQTDRMMLAELLDSIALKWVPILDLDRSMMQIASDLGAINEDLRCRWSYDPDVNAVDRGTMLVHLAKLFWDCVEFNHSTDEYTELEILATITNARHKTHDSSLYNIRTNIYKCNRKHIMGVIDLVYALGFTFDDLYGEVVKHI